MLQENGRSQPHNMSKNQAKAIKILIHDQVQSISTRNGKVVHFISTSYLFKIRGRIITQDDRQKVHMLIKNEDFVPRKSATIDVPNKSRHTEP